MLFLLSVATFLIFQEQTWYEHYDQGQKALKAEDYRTAIRELEAAVALQPRSKKQAKTYGVQFITYYPYHQLAAAHLWTGNVERAEFFLRRAYAEKEDSVERNALTMELLTNFIARYPSEPEIEERPDTTALWELISMNKYTAAQSVLQDLREAFPNNAELQGLTGILRVLISNEEELRDIEKEAEANVDNLLSDAQLEEEQGNFARALSFYTAVTRLKPRHQQAQFAITRLTERMEAEGQTAAEIEEAMNAALRRADKSNEMLLNTMKQQRELQLTNSRLHRELEKTRASLSKPDPAVISVDWDLIPISEQNLTAMIQAEIASDTALKNASLYINDKLLSSWDLFNNKEFQIPTIPKHTFPKLSNILRLEIRDMHNQIHQRVYPYTFPRPAQPKAPFLRKVFLITLAILTLGLFFIRQRKKRQAFRNRFNPYIAGAPVLNDKMFFGRRPMLKQLLNTLHNNSLMIYGERRIGKTSFLHQLDAILPELDDPHYEFFPVFIDLQGVKEDQFFGVIDHEITMALEPKGIHLDPPPESIDGRILTQRLRKYVGQLKQTCTKSPKLVLLLDEVDIMNGFSEQTNQQLRSVFMKGFAKHLVAVMAGININTTWKSEGSPWYNFFEQLELKPFTDEQAKSLVTDPVRGVYQYNADAVDKIVTVTKGKPYLIQKMCVNLVAHVLNENRRKITAKDVNFVYNEIRHEVEKG